MMDHQNEDIEKPAQLYVFFEDQFANIKDENLACDHHGFNCNYEQDLGRGTFLGTQRGFDSAYHGLDQVQRYLHHQGRKNRHSE
jgi:hypothetical protein